MKVISIKMYRDKTTIGKKLVEADRTGYPIIIVIGTSAILTREHCFTFLRHLAFTFSTNANLF